MANTEKRDRKVKSEDSTKKQSDFPCPVCASDDTVSFVPTEMLRLMKKDKSVSFPVVYGAAMMPNYLRHRRCNSCEASWRTCESIIMDSIQARNGEVVG